MVEREFILEGIEEETRARATRLAGVGPEAAAELFCEVAEDVRKLLLQVVNSNKLLKSIHTELVKSREGAMETVRPVVEGRAQLEQAVRRMDDNTQRVVDAVSRLVDRL